MASAKIISAAVAGLIILGVAIFLLGARQPAATQGSAYITNSQSAPPNAPAPNSTATLFSSTPYAQFAYLVSASPLSSQAQAVLAGFNLTRTQNQNGTITMAITLLANGQKQEVNLMPGDKLYFIETSFGDDSFGGESNLGDDGIVLVNANGYVVQ